MTDFTVLVAVFNAERYLRQCLDSLLGQTLRSIEVICVDDASTDASADILQTYARSDCRVRVISRHTNGGAAKARNDGLRMATGKYTCFCDSDDWLAPDALERVKRLFDDYELTDCVLFRCVKVFGQRQVPYQMKTFNVMSGKEAFRASLTWKIHGVYAVRTELHKRFPYDDSAHSYSDDNTTRLHYLFAREVRCSDACYFYRQHQGSVTHQVSLGRLDYLKANMSMRRQLMGLGVGQDVLCEYEDMRWLNVIDSYQFYWLHRKALGKDGSHMALERIREAWKSIDRSELSRKYTRKLGYGVHKGHWMLFRMEEELYFLCKKMLGRIEPQDC